MGKYTTKRHRINTILHRGSTKSILLSLVIKYFVEAVFRPSPAAPVATAFVCPRSPLATPLRGSLIHKTSSVRRHATMLVRRYLSYVRRAAAAAGGGGATRRLATTPACDAATNTLH